MPATLQKLLLALALTAVVMISNGVPAISAEYRTQLDAPYLASPTAFAFELAGAQAVEPPAQWIEAWFFHQAPPANARVLAKLPIYLGCRALRAAGLSPLAAFYASYRGCELVLLLHFLLLGAQCCATAVQVIAPTRRHDPHVDTLLAMVMLALSPPVLFACKFPVHGTPNDLLGYALLAAAMQALFSARLGLYCALSLLGVLCRETNLVTLLPLVLLGTERQPLRAGIALAIIASTLTFRAWLGGSYDPLAGAHYNWEHPLESLGFVYLTFGPLWLPAMFYALSARRAAQADTTRRFTACALLSVPLVLAVVTMFARLREIRIPFVLFIYVVPLALLGTRQFFADFTPRRGAVLLATLSLGAVLTFRLYVALMPLDFAAHAHRADALASLYGGFGGGWLTELLAYFLFATPALAVSISQWRAARPVSARI